MIKKLTVILILFFMPALADAWTNDPFRLANSQVRSSDGKEWKHWYVKTHPEDVDYASVYRYGNVTQVMLIRTFGEADHILVTRKGFKDKPAYSRVLSMLREAMHSLDNFLKEAELISLSYHVELAQMTVFAHPKHDRNKALYSKIEKVLNEERKKFFVARQLD